MVGWLHDYSNFTHEINFQKFVDKKKLGGGTFSLRVFSFIYLFILAVAYVQDNMDTI